MFFGHVSNSWSSSNNSHIVRFKNQLISHESGNNIPWSFVTPMLCSGLPIHNDGTPVNASVSCISNQIFVCTHALCFLLSFLILYTWKALS